MIFLVWAALLLLPAWGHADSSFYDRLSSSDPAVRHKAMDDFKNFTPDVKERLVPDIMVAARDDNPDVQQDAQTLLKNVQASKQASDQDLGRDIRKQAPPESSQGDAMKEIQNSKQESFPDMKQALEEEKKSQGSLDSDEFQAERKSLSAGSALIGSLNDPDPFVRAHAARRLSQVHPIPLESIEPLTGLLQDKETDVRAAAAGTLGSIGPAAKSAIPALLRTLADPDPGVRQIAADALKEIQAPE